MPTAREQIDKELDRYRHMVKEVFNRTYKNLSNRENNKVTF